MNCKGHHSTVSRTCPEVKKVLNSSKVVPSKSYSSVVRDREVGPSPAQPTDGGVENVISKTVMCLVIAMMKEAEAGGSFGETLESLLSQNNLPIIKIKRIAWNNL